MRVRASAFTPQNLRLQWQAAQSRPEENRPRFLSVQSIPKTQGCSRVVLETSRCVFQSNHPRCASAIPSPDGKPTFVKSCCFFETSVSDIPERRSLTTSSRFIQRCASNAPPIAAPTEVILTSFISRGAWLGCVMGAAAKTSGCRRAFHQRTRCVRLK